MPLISPPKVPIPEVDPIETNGYCTVNTSLSSRIVMIWCTADVWPEETLTNDFTLVSKSLKIDAYVITELVPVS